MHSDFSFIISPVFIWRLQSFNKPSKLSTDFIFFLEEHSHSSYSSLETQHPPIYFINNIS